MSFLVHFHFLSFLALLLLVFCFYKQNGVELSSSNRSFTIENDRFVLNGQDIQLVSGSIHYFRVHPEYWQDRLERVKSIGFNAIELYVAWNFHEQQPGTFLWDGWQNIEKFISLAQQQDLLVLLRPGPYICAEWDNGGLPAWLLNSNVTKKDLQKIKFRSMDSTYLKYVRRWWCELLPRMKPLLYENGGPIVMVQIENEFGFVGHDEEYLLYLKNLARSYLGNNIILYTTDPPGIAQYGTIPNDSILTTVDFGPFWYNPNYAFGVAKKLNSPQKSPPICTEFYSGWLTRWGEKMAYTSPGKLAFATKEVLLAVNKTGSVNFYMVHGGTSFGFWAGASYGSVYMPDITSYDYDAIISEGGGQGDLLSKTYYDNQYSDLQKNYLQSEHSEILVFSDAQKSKNSQENYQHFLQDIPKSWHSEFSVFKDFQKSKNSQENYQHFYQDVAKSQQSEFSVFTDLQKSKSSQEIHQHFYEEIPKSLNSKFSVIADISDHYSEMRKLLFKSDVEIVGQNIPPEQKYYMDKYNKGYSKYTAIRDVLKNTLNITLANEMNEPQAKSYGLVKFDKILAFSNVIEKLSCVQGGLFSHTPLNMEQYGQYYGIIVYRTFIKYELLCSKNNISQKSFLEFTARDYSIVQVNGKKVGFKWINQNDKLIDLKINCEDLYSSQDVQIDIIVEAMGRNNFYKTDLTKNLKGIIGPVKFNSKLELFEWTVFPLPLSENIGTIFNSNENIKHYNKNNQFIEKGINFSNNTQNCKIQSKFLNFSDQKDRFDFEKSLKEDKFQNQIKKQIEENNYNIPLFFMGNFNISLNENPMDTYIDVQNWHKGIVWINEFNLGRFWSDMGPQLTMYVPKFLLKQGLNEIIILELSNITSSLSVNFVAKPNFSGTKNKLESF